MFVASSLEHLHVMWKTRRELGKEERWRAVLATVDSERGDAPVRFRRGRVGNAAYLGLIRLSEEVDEVREVLAELCEG